MQGFYGMPIKSSAYGDGKIKEWDGQTVTVIFGDKAVRFWFPKAFESGALSATNDADKQILREIIDQRVMAVIERERTSMGKGSSEAHVQALAVRLASYFRNCYTVEDLTEKINRSIEEEKRLKLLMVKAPAAKDTAEPSPLPAKETRDAAHPSGETPKAAKPKRKGEIRINFGNATFIIGIVLSVLSLCGLILIPIGRAVDSTVLLYVGLAAFLAVGFIAHCVFNEVKAYFSANGEKGAKYVVSILCFILTFIPYYLLFLFVSCAIFVVKTFVGLVGGNFSSSSSSSKKVIEIHDEYANVRKLTKVGSTYVGSTLYDRYRDDLGHYWLSTDERNFKREN